MLLEWNNTARDYPADTCLHELIEAQVKRTPDAVALVFENEALTYRELNRRANQLAHYLRKLGVGPDAIVGVFAERSIAMVVGLLAIIKAGGAYSPIDPNYPIDRLAFLLGDGKPRAVLAQRHLFGNCLGTSQRSFASIKIWSVKATLTRRLACVRTISRT